MKKFHVVLLVVSFLMMACGTKQPSTFPKQENIQAYVYASGILKSKDQYQVYAPVSGIVQEIYVKEGDTVKTGQALLKISAEMQRYQRENAALNKGFSDFSANQSKLEDAAQGIEVSKLKWRNDSLLWARAFELFKQNIGSKVELEQRELAFQNSRANYISAQIKYRELKRQLEFVSEQAKRNFEIYQKQEDDFIIKSEVSGLVYNVLKEKGEMVSPQMPVAVLGSASQFILEMQVDENDITKINLGQKVFVRLDSYKNQVFSAQVSKIQPWMNERSKAFTIEALFTELPLRVYPNITFEANILYAEKEQAITIPREFLIKDSLVLSAQGDTLRVKVGLKDYEKVEVLSGLTTKDELLKP